MVNLLSRPLILNWFPNISSLHHIEIGGIRQCTILTSKIMKLDEAAYLTISQQGLILFRCLNKDKKSPLKHHKILFSLASIACSKSSTSSGTPSSSSPPAAPPSDFPDAEYCSAIFFRLSKLSGPSWLMMPVNSGIQGRYHGYACQEINAA